MDKFKCKICQNEFKAEFFCLEQYKCILHCEKDNWYKIKNNGIKEWHNENGIMAFWLLLQLNLEKLIRDNFKNIIFPVFEEGNEENYRQINFFKIEEEALEISTILDNNINFNNCIFCDIANFEDYYFNKSISFRNCQFKKGILLNNKYSVPLRISNGCNFYNNDLDLSNKIFNKSFSFIDNIDVGNINCKNTIFNITSFRNSKFKNANFSYTNFNDKVSFIESEFEENIEFKFTEFNKITFFRDAVFKGKLDLRDAIFKDEVNFLNLKNKNGNKLETKNVSNRETARIIKHSFEKLDNIIEANKFYALEMEKREEELNSLKYKDNNLIDWLVFKIHGISSNYSQDWILALLWILNITFLYNIFNKISPCSMDILLFFNISLIILIITVDIIYKLLCFNKLIYLKLILFISSFFLYSMSNTSFNIVANNINPFSIMTGKEILTIDLFIYKIIIAYLIYQLIISLRQNTRRK